MTRDHAQSIADIARGHLARLWRRRAEIWSGNIDAARFILVAPDALVVDLGYQLNRPSAIANEVGLPGEVPVQIAGVIDTAERTISIARIGPLEYQRFTLAHELGHAVLHGKRLTYHRDHPLSGAERLFAARPAVEREADTFAAALLMPTKFVAEAFASRFESASDWQKAPAHLAPLLSAGTGQRVTPQDLVQRGARYRANLFAQATSFADVTFPSLTKVFAVSLPAMAIRLEELGLVR